MVYPEIIPFVSCESGQKGSPLPEAIISSDGTRVACRNREAAEINENVAIWAQPQAQIYVADAI